MNGPDHFREAERLLADAARYNATSDQGARMLMKAQVHAQLAMVAISVGATFGIGRRTQTDWREAVGTETTRHTAGDTNQATLPTQENQES
jgi:hypothetical protein